MNATFRSKKVTSTSKVKQIEPWIDSSELTYLKEVIYSTYVNESAMTQRFEQRISKTFGATFVSCMANGTMALYSALVACGIGPGDEVLVPNITFIATSNAVILSGATPVFVDVNNSDYTLDPVCCEKAINKNTKAIIPVQLYGRTCDMDSVNQLASKYSLKVIEDAAQAVGVRYKNRFAGTLGNIGVFSFYSNKTITTGEGGCILTEDKDLFNSCYSLKNHGRDRKGTFVHEKIGYNFCFTDLQAALGMAQLDKLKSIIELKKQIHDRYLNDIRWNPSYIIPLHTHSYNVPVHWFTSIIVEDRHRLEVFLADNNIETRRFFCPLHIQPCYRYMGISSHSFNNSLYAYEHGLSLPSAAKLEQDRLEYTINLINKFYD